MYVSRLVTCLQCGDAERFTGYSFLGQIVSGNEAPRNSLTVMLEVVVRGCVFARECVCVCVCVCALLCFGRVPSCV